MKDFAAEIRAHLDVEQFLSQAQLMLDVHETNMERILEAMEQGMERILEAVEQTMERILEAMLHHLLDSDEQSGDAAFHDAKKVLFTHDSGIHTHRAVY